jgi:hypothetical protein
MSPWTGRILRPRRAASAVPLPARPRGCAPIEAGARRATHSLDPSQPHPGATGRADSPNQEVVLNPDTKKYNDALSAGDRAIARRLATEIDRGLPEAENKVWHGHPVWFLEGNPIVGYSKLKDCVRLLFWSGQSFQAGGLKREGSFKAAEARYTAVGQVDAAQLRAWLKEARDVQWDYKNIVKRKGKLLRLK